MCQLERLTDSGDTARSRCASLAGGNARARAGRDGRTSPLLPLVLPGADRLFSIAS